MKKTKWLSGFMAVLMLVSMLACIVLPAAAAPDAVNSALATYTGDYTIEYKAEITTNMANVIFAGSDASEYFFVQMNKSTGQIKLDHYNGDSSSHRYRDQIAPATAFTDKTNASVIHESKTAENAVALLAGTEYAFKIDVSGLGTSKAAATVYMAQAGEPYGDALVTLNDTEMVKPAFGFRHCSGNPADAGYYDDLKITAANGIVLYENDFSGTRNPFEKGGIVNGRYYLSAADEGGSVERPYSFAELAANTIEAGRKVLDYSGAYTITYDMIPTMLQPGIAFGQINGGNKNLSFATLEGGGTTLNLRDYNSAASGFAVNKSTTLGGFTWSHNTKYSIKIAVDAANTSATVTVTDSSGNTATVTGTGGTFNFGGLGFRHCAASTAAEGTRGFYDNIKVTDADGTVLFSEDFSSGDNPFMVGAIRRIDDTGALVNSGGNQWIYLDSTVGYDRWQDGCMSDNHIAYTESIAGLVAKQAAYAAERAEASGDASGIVNLYNFYHTDNTIFNADGSAAEITEENRYQYCTTYDYIAVTPGETLYYGPVYADQAYHFAAYNTEKAPIGADCRVSGTATIQINSRYAICSYTVPEGTAYIRVSAPTETADTFLLTAGRAFTNGDRKSFFARNPLQGKSGLFVGDSITAATGQDQFNNFGWAGRIGGMYQLNATNGGVSAASLSVSRGTNRILTQLNTYGENTYDYVLLHGGVNDAWDSIPVGEMTEGFDPNEFDTDTYAGGLEEAIYTAIQYFGEEAAIGYLFNFRAPNYDRGNVDDMAPYFLLAREICDKWDVQYCDLFSNPKVTKEMKIEEEAEAAVYGGTHLGNDLQTEDFIHPNSSGYDILSPYIGQFMTTMTPYDQESFLEKELARYRKEAAALDRSYFTADSLARYDAILAGAGTADDYQAAIAELEQGDKKIPLTLLKNESYQNQKAYSVSSAAEFVLLNDYKQWLTKDMVVCQTANIDLTGYTNIEIGTNLYPFAATYDGQGFTISNLKNSPKATQRALFRVMSGKLRNVTFKNALTENAGWGAMLVYTVVGTDVLLENVHIVDSAYYNVSNDNGSCFFAYGAGSNALTLRNCTITGSTMYLKNEATAGAGNAGLFCAVTGGAVLENCYAYGNTIDVTGTTNWDYIGFIAGNGGSAQVTACGGADNTLTGTNIGSHTGGLFGTSGGATLTECYTDTAKLYTGGTPASADTTKNFTAVPAIEIADGTLNTKLKAVSGRGWEQNAAAGIPMAIQKTLVGIEVTTEPAKTTYLEGEEFNTTGLVVAAKYNNNTSEVITDYTLSGYSSTPGEKTIIVKKGNFTDTFTVMVKEKSMTKIKVTTAPIKTTYLEGDAALDPAGLVVTVYYDNNTSEVITDYTLSGYSSTPGEKIITVKKGNFTDTFTVTVKAKSLSSIEITQKPQKLTYEIGEELDLTGLKVTAKYNNNTSGVVTGYTVSGKTDKAGEQTVTVTFEGKKATFKITVLEALPFKDVKKGDWFYPGVLYSYRAGLMNGTSATIFAPNMNMTRAQMVMILYNLEGQPSVKGMKNPFKDVPTGKWYTNAVLWAANEGLVYGTSATTFAPDLELSRSQLVTILFRYAQEKGLDNGARDNLKGFADKATVPSWALEATQWAVANKIVSGIPSGNKLNVAPLTVATRSQVATILKGFLDK